MQHIQNYDDNNIFIDNSIEELVINYITVPLNNIPPSVNKITINISFDVLKHEHRLPYNCELVVNEFIVDTIETFEKITEYDYNDVTNLRIDGYELTKDRLNIITKLSNIRELDLCYCELDSLPEEINSLMKLEWIHLAKNHISSRHKSLDELKKRGVKMEFVR